MRIAIANGLRACRLIAGACVTVLPVAIWNGSWPQVTVLIVAIVVLVAGSMVARTIDPDDPDERARTTIVGEVALSWCVVAVVGSVVTMLLARTSPGDPSQLSGFGSALFETVSGVTTTGLSVVESAEALDPTMQWWRSILQMVGAIGVVVFGLVVGERSGDDDRYFGVQWGTRPAEQARTAARRILIVLGAVTGIGFAALVATGEPVWNSLNHATTAASTGGFAIVDDSAASLGGASKLVLAIIFIVPAISFATLWGAVTGNGAPLWKRTQVRWTLATTGLTALGAIAIAASEPDIDLGSVAFDAVSASTTTGFASGALFQSVPALAMLTMISMFIGGSVGSTAGGVKVARVAWIGKGLRRWLPMGPDVGEDPYVWDGDEVEPEEAKRRIVGASSIIGLFALATTCTTLVLMLSSGADLDAAAFEAVSALSNVGLTSGTTGPDTDEVSKQVLTVAMILGRVEITAFIALAWSVRRVRRA